jgi:alpha-ketoglutarate-dependent taurine dioxygenase
MNYHIHENGWTVIVDEIDLKNPTQEDAKEICRLLDSNTLVIIPGTPGTDITMKDELKFVNLFHEIETYDKPPESETVGKCVLPDSECKILPVTGKKITKDGKTGVFGHPAELKWHCNGPASPASKLLVYLRAIEGTKGSVTQWTNNFLAYDDLDTETKEVIKDLEGVFGHDPIRISPALEHMPGRFINEEYTPKIVRENKQGRKGIFLPYLQMFYFKGMTEEESQPLIEKLAGHITQEKFIYSHEWNDGDVIIADMVFGLHRRLEFADIENRLLHRVAFNYIEQDYLNPKK